MAAGASAPPAVVVRGLVKRYASTTALDGFDLEIPRGAVCGVVGPNGAGKTTAFAAIAGLVRLDAGSVRLFGEGPFEPRRHAGRLGLMPQDASPSPHATLAQSLTYYARLQGKGPDEARREAQRWLSRVGLEGREQSKLRQLSHGMRRRVSLAQALMGEPELILLDEPLSGLDPELVAQVRDLLSERRGQATLVISSHVLSELEELCDYVAFVEAGRCARQGTMASVRRADVLIGFRLSQAPDLQRLKAEVEGASFDWREPMLEVVVDAEQPIERHNARILRSLLDSGVGVLEVSLGESLERSYLARRRS